MPYEHRQATTGPYLIYDKSQMPCLKVLLCVADCWLCLHIVWLQEYIFRLPYKLNHINVELEINMPLEVRDENKEEMSKVGIINSYKEFLEREKKLSIMGVIRIGYYMITAAILLSCWYIIKTSKGESLLTSLLNSGGTVLLWQIMTLIFIEGKNFRYKLRINKKLSNMNIVFKYI